MRKLKLLYSIEYVASPPKEKAKICNGMGASGWPQWLIDAMNSPLFCYGVSLRECGNIHDWDYFMGLTQEDKVIADRRFGENMLRTIKHYSKCRWINPLYYLRRKRTKMCYLAVKYGGDYAFWKGKDKY